MYTIKDLERIREEVLEGEIDENQCRDIIYDLTTELIGVLEAQENSGEPKKEQE